jgi:long-chain acyl-CoA synthetase
LDFEIDSWKRMATANETRCETLVGFLAQVAGEHVGQAGQHRGGVILPQTAEQQEFRWQEVAALAGRAADSLARRGIGPGDRVALAAANSLDWIVADFAIQMLGAVVVPLHVSLSGQQLAWQIAHSGSRLLILQGQMLGDKLAGTLSAEMPLISFEPAVDPRTKTPVPLWPDVVAAGSEDAGRDRWRATLAAIDRHTLASIVYTSGTSGEPRGVMQTQGNLAANALATCASFNGRSDDCRLNLLPFSHAFGRMSDLYVSLAGNTRLALARSRETMFADAQQVRPTLLVVVPLVLARLRQAAVAQFGASDPVAVQKLLGGQLRGFICGGAPLAAELHEYYAAQGTPVWEGYGLTEAGPVVSASNEMVNRPHSVGRPIEHTAVQIAADGEILINGPQVMAGYWQDEVATRETLHTGWLHTGDLGSIDSDGFLFLHGRKKEFIALASGKKIWPAAIEERFAGDPLIEQIMLVGEGEPALGALIVPRQRDETESNTAELNSAQNQQRFLHHLALQQSGSAAHEQIRHVWLLAEPWTAEREELTPKLTLRRQTILRRYADCVRHLFAAH